MHGDRLPGTPDQLVRIGGAQRSGLGNREPARHVPGQRIVRRGLIRDEVEVLAASRELRHDVGGVPEQPDRECSTVARRRAHARERVVQRVGRLVEIPRLQPTVDARLVDLDAENRAARERRGQRPGAAHAPEPGREDRAPGK